MAVRRKHVKLTELLAKNFIKKRHQKLDRSSNTLLHDAVRLGQLKVVIILVGRGADVNASTRNGMTPLHVAAKHGYLKIMDFLISNGAHMNARCKDGYTPLHFACESANLKCARLLLKHNASVIPTNVNDIHPIDITVAHLFLKMTQLLLDYGASMAVNKGHDGYQLSEIGYEDEYFSLLHYTVARRSLPMAKLLLKYGADVNTLSKDGISPLHEAVMGHNIPMVKLLLNNGALIRISKDYCNRQMLVTYGLFFNRSGIPPYYCKTHYSLVDKKLEILKLLIDAGASSEMEDPSVTLFDYCIGHGFRKIVNYLLYHTNLNFDNLDDALLKRSVFDIRLIHQFPEIVNDTEYITKRELECKELTYDLMAEKYSRHLIGSPSGNKLSVADLSRFRTALKVTKEEHKDRLKNIKNNIQGVVDEMKREKID
ncbi:ankyrin-3-like [Microplitis mediator]|uniref:ankyrin-3-like n=1 Tax=Microplitis mediator TaxID=375433 RepID=UPI00255408DA|nr:ankyrin-3-like [Microplitis mediator]